MVRDERGEAWVTVRAFLAELVLFMLGVVVLIALCAVTPQ